MSDNPSQVFFVGQGADGTFAAYRDQEPLFCIIRNTEQEAVDVALETFKAYDRLFRHRSGQLAVRALNGLLAHVISSPKTYKIEEVV